MGKTCRFFLKFTPVLLGWILLALTAGMAFPASPQGPEHVLIISVDGLRPDFYLREGEAAFQVPMLRQLMKNGSYARMVEGIFPSVTFPSHATIVTGVRPAKHGIPYNAVYDPTGERRGWYWFASDIKAKTLWEAAWEKGLKTAALGWPSTVGAGIDYLISEYDWQDPEVADLIKKHSTPGLIERVEKVAGPLTLEVARNRLKWDAFLTAAAVEVIKRYKPNLILLHLVQTDGAQHDQGREGEKVRQAVARVDGHIGQVIQALKEARIFDPSAIIITGDHGFADIRAQVAPNVLFRKVGLLKRTRERLEWQAFTHVTGAAAAVFVKDPKDAELTAKVEKLLLANSVKDGERLYNVLSRAELDALGTMPGASFGLEAEEGYSLSGAFREGTKFLRPLERTRGTHGYLPTRPSMSTGFIAAGRGFKQGAVIGKIKLIDIAPTVSRLLGLRLPDIEGTAIQALLSGETSRSWHRFGPSSFRSLAPRHHGSCPV